MVRPAEGKRSDDADEFCTEENADACQELRARFLKIATVARHCPTSIQLLV